MKRTNWALVIAGVMTLVVSGKLAFAGTGNLPGTPVQPPIVASSTAMPTCVATLVGDERTADNSPAGPSKTCRCVDTGFYPDAGSSPTYASGDGDAGVISLRYQWCSFTSITNTAKCFGGSATVCP